MARKILLADDSVTAQNMGRKILADAGYEVITVNNGSAALKKIAEVKPDLVILDVYMPGYSGLEVCQRLKESADSYRIPVMLTVGKLEPFKPEEAQRVRAEGFIVKPFEASELLSALSKLEDKVVPRPESSKPGRFARAIAAVEESSMGRSTEFGEADENGWKSRITFPHKKTEIEQAEEKAADDASIYNPVNRDLRTVVESRAEAVAEEKEFRKYNRRKSDRLSPPPAEESTVDVAALASPGLPQDVTAEEVAAIAAAAAQIKTLQATLEQEASAPAATEPFREETVLKASLAAKESLSEMPVMAAPAPETQAAALADRETTTEPIRVQSEPHKSDDPVIHAAANQVNEFAANETRANETRANEARAETGENEKDEETDLPVTMALASSEVSVSAHGNSSQWTAVAVALDAAEASMSLEHEMQKAYAPVPAEEPAAAKCASEPEPVAPQNISAPEPVSAAATQLPPEPLPHAVPELQTQAEPVSMPELTTPPALPDTSFPSSVAAAPEPIVAETIPDSQQPAPAPEPVNKVVPEPVAQTPSETISEPAEPAVAAVTSAAPQLEPEAQEPAAPAVSHHPFTSFIPSVPASIPKVPDPRASDHASVEAESNLTPSLPEESRWSPASSRPDPEEDPETIKTTAAAWASWRQIRDANAPRPAVAELPNEVPNPVPEGVPDSIPAPQEASAAMAVAAGAEQAPTEQSASDPIQTIEPSAELPGDVASIVDSLLADLRPKLMAEISRKMSEKK